MKSPIESIQDLADKRLAGTEVFDALLGTIVRNSEGFSIADVMDGISEYVFVKRECGIDISNKEWSIIEKWMSDNWLSDYSYIENAVWIIFRGRMLSLLPLVEQLLDSNDARVREEAVQMLEAWDQVWRAESAP